MFRFSLIFTILIMSSGCAMLRPPLMQATMDKNWPKVSELAVQKKDLNTQNLKGQTPLMIMVETADFSTAKMPAGSSKFQMLGNALAIMLDKNTYQEYQAFEDLLDSGANPNIADYTGKTPLMAAAQKGYYLVVAELLKYKADPYQKDLIGRTALMYSVDDKIKAVIEQGL